MGQFDPARLNTDAAARDEFVAAIEASGSLGGAAAATGTSLSTAFRRRRRDPAFGQACEDALARRRGWKLETALIERAIHGVVRVRTHKDDSVTTWVDYDHRLGMWLLTKLLPGRYGVGAATRAAPPPRRTMSPKEFLAVVEAQPDGPTPAPAPTGGSQSQMILA